MLLIVNMTGDIAQLNQVFFHPAEDATGLRFMLFVSGSFGFVITMVILLAITLCGPIALNITGTLKDVVLTALGFFFFPDDVKISQSLFVGLAISFTGATYYSYNKYKDHREKEAKEKAEKIQSQVLSNRRPYEGGEAEPIKYLSSKYGKSNEGGEAEPVK